MSTVTMADLPPPAASEPPAEDEVVAGWGRATDPLVSVKCATYNHGAFIRSALLGFVGQRTSFPFEVVVHDDASDDGTTDVVREFAARYPRVIRPILQTENQYRLGRNPAQIIEQACSGRYIALCEGDDYWTDPRKLQRQVDALEADPSSVCAFQDAFEFDAGGVVTSTLAKEKRDLTAEELLLRRASLPTLTLLYRRGQDDAPEKHRCTNPDVFLISMLGRRGGAKFVGDLHPAAYRRHAGGVWSQRSTHDQRFERARTFHLLAEYHERTGAPSGVVWSLRRRACVQLLGDDYPEMLRMLASIVAYTATHGARRGSRWIRHRRDLARTVLP